MLGLFSTALLLVSVAASRNAEWVFSRELAEKEGYTLTTEQELVDAFVTVMDHITKNSKHGGQSFDGDYLLNMLKENRHIPFLKAFEEKFQPIHDDSKSSVHSLREMMEVWDEIATEHGITSETSKDVFVRHEKFDEIVRRMDVEDHGHRGKSAFGGGKNEHF